MLDEILKQINQAVAELNQQGIKCSFDNQIKIIKQ